MKSSLVLVLCSMMVASLAHAEENLDSSSPPGRGGSSNGGGGGNRSSGGNSNSGGSRSSGGNSNSGGSRNTSPAPRPTSQPHPTIERPVEHPPAPGGGHVPDNKPRPPAPVEHHDTPVENHGGADNHHGGPVVGHNSGMRPVHVDTRRPEEIRRDRLTQRVRFGYRPVREWGYPREWFWVYPVGTTWVNVSSVTCQARFEAADPANPNANAIYTADGTHKDWSNGWQEGPTENAVLGEALDECFAANADPVTGVLAGTCLPLENPNDVDGCFLTYGYAQH